MTESPTSAGFVYVEHIDQLRSEQEDLNEQVRALTATVERLQTEHERLQQRIAIRWPIVKAAVLLIILNLLAAFSQQNDRHNILKDVLINGVPPHVASHRLDRLNDDHWLSPNFMDICATFFALPWLFFCVIKYMLHDAAVQDEIANALHSADDITVDDDEATPTLTSDDEPEEVVDDVTATGDAADVDEGKVKVIRASGASGAACGFEQAGEAADADVITRQLPDVDGFD